MKLVDLHSNQEFIAEIIEVDDDDYKMIKKSKQFGFNWVKEKKNSVFKIIRKSEDEENAEILGLISIIDIAEEFRIHINLVENAKDNKGKNKKIDRVAGCLMAFASKIAFEKGYLGFTSLVPKTELIELYVNKYGFKQYGRQLAIDKRDAINLIQKYLS